MSGFFSRVFSRLVGPFAEVHPGERTKTFLMFCYFLLTISTIYILKPVRSSLFLSEFSADKLRYVNIGEGLFLIAVVWLYSLAARRLSHKVLYPAVLGFLIGTLLLFWFFARRNLPYVSAAFYIWQSAFSAMITTQFWILANDIFRPEEAKRLFGLIISGGSLGGILGGIITNFAVRWLRTEDLLLVVVVILVLCIFLISFLWKCILPKASGAVEVGGGIAAAGTHEALKEKEAKKHPFATASYLALIAGIIVIAKMSSTIVENQFGGVVQMAIRERRDYGFLRRFYGWQNALSFILQLVITGSSSNVTGRDFSGSCLWALPVCLVIALSPALLSGFLQDVRFGNELFDPAGEQGDPLSSDPGASQAEGQARDRHVGLSRRQNARGNLHGAGGTPVGTFC